MKLIALSSILILASCASYQEVRPDGTVITEKAMKEDTKRFLGDLIRAYSPRPIAPRAEPTK